MNITEAHGSTPERLLIEVIDTGVAGLAAVSFGAACFHPDPGWRRRGQRAPKDGSSELLIAPTIHLTFQRLNINGKSIAGYSDTYRPYRLDQPNGQRSVVEVLTHKGIHRIEYEVHSRLKPAWGRFDDIRALRSTELCEKIAATYLTFDRAKSALAEYFTARVAVAQDTYVRARVGLTRAWNELAAIEALDERAPVPGYPSFQAQSLQRALLAHAHNTCSMAHWQPGPARDSELDRTVAVVTDEWERAYDCLRDGLPDEATADVLQEAAENLIGIVLERVLKRLRVAHNDKHVCLLGEHTCGLGDIDTFIAIARTFLTALAASEVSTPTSGQPAHW